MRFIVILFVVVFCFSHKVDAQCFASPGNPVGGTANTGTLKKKSFRIISFYQYNYSDKYFEGDKLPKKYVPLYEKADYNYAGIMLGYGLTKKLTVEVEAGYFINKTIYYNKDRGFNIVSARGYGLSNTVVSVKYSIYKNDEKRFGWAASVGGKIPFSREPQAIDGADLPIDIQPSTGSFGVVVQSFLMKEFPFKAYRLFLINRFETNSTGILDYKYGNIYTTALIVSKHLHFPWTKGDGSWTAIVQLKNKVAAKRSHQGEIVPSSGSNVCFVSPQLNFTVNKKLNISFLYNHPVYQYYNGIQLANTGAFTVSIIKDFYKTEAESTD